MVLTGKRREYIEIQSATRTSDSQGGWTTGWTHTAYDWAHAVVKSQSRIPDNGGIRYTKVVEFNIRIGNAYTLTTADRIVWNSENYTIHSVLRNEKNDNNLVICYAS